MIVYAKLFLLNSFGEMYFLEESCKYSGTSIFCKNALYIYEIWECVFRWIDYTGHVYGYTVLDIGSNRIRNWYRVSALYYFVDLWSQE